jgi:hypothetical protein
MKQIFKNSIDTTCINAYAYLHPHPLDIETNGNFEVDEISWIPGFDSSDIGEDGEHPFFRDQNIQLYNKIEAVTLESFRVALKNIWPLLDSYIVNSIQIAIDITGNLFTDSKVLASYNFEDSSPQKGNYIFNLAPRYLAKLLKKSENNADVDIKYNTIWEHELIHLIDHWQSVKSSVYCDSDVSSIYFNFYLSQYRTEGIAELYYLLKGGIQDVKSMAQAKEKFQNNIYTIRKLVSDMPILSKNDKDKLFKTYDFYELGPWIILDVLITFEGGCHEKLIADVIEQVEAGKSIEHDVILEVIKIALRIKLNEFINFHIK